MTQVPLQPARIDFAGGVPAAPDFGDTYHPRAGAFEQARHVFLHGNGLPGRWAGRDHFVVLETGFGLGNNFLATWQAWRDDPARSRRLWFVSVEAHPPRQADLQRAHAASPAPALAAALVAAWPPATPGLHPIDFDDGRVRLLLALGDVAQCLPALRLAADAVYLDGFAPARNPAMWAPEVFDALARLAAPGATAATWSVARCVHDGLQRAGFTPGRAPGIGGKREITVAHFAPRFVPRPPPAERAGPRPAHVAVVGAGLAGAAVAHELAALGIGVTVLDAAPAPAQGASGNPGGLLHGVVHPDDGPHARWLRAGALLAARAAAAPLASGAVAGHLDGLLRLHRPAAGDRSSSADIAGHDAAAGPLAPAAARHLLPADYAEPLEAAEAARRVGLAVPAGGWWFAGGGWLAPGDWVRHLLAAPGIVLRMSAPVAALHRGASRWQVLGPGGRVLEEADAVVLANAEAAAGLIGAWATQDRGVPLEGPGSPAPGAPPLPAWPLRRTRGQVSWHERVPGPLPAVPVAGDGYALSLGPGRLLCGATRDDDDGHDTLPRPADLQRNLQRLQQLLPVLAAPAPDADGWHGRVGWRLATDDKLPMAGPVMAAGTMAPATQVRQVLRAEGLWVLTALGSRGLTLAPLAARLVAARLAGLPWPVERALADAVDPARWAVRACRRGG